jgi:glutaredoxin 3
MLFRRKGVRTKEIDVSVDRRKREWLRQITGQATVPQIFINGIHVGGSSELYELERSGALDELLGTRRQAQA